MGKLLACLVVVSVSSVSINAQDWKKDLQAKLQEVYKLAKIERRSRALQEPGTPLIVQQPGIQGGDGSQLIVHLARVQDGRFKTPYPAQNEHEYNLKPGDKVYPLDLDVNDDNVALTLVTAFPIGQIMATGQSSGSVGGVVGGVGVQRHFTARVRFDFNKDFLRTADAAAVVKAISAILPTEENVAAASTKTIELGQTFEQVERSTASRRILRSSVRKSSTRTKT